MGVVLERKLKKLPTYIGTFVKMHVSIIVIFLVTISQCSFWRPDPSTPPTSTTTTTTTATTTTTSTSTFLPDFDIHYSYASGPLAFNDNCREGCFYSEYSKQCVGNFRSS